MGAGDFLNLRPQSKTMDPYTRYQPTAAWLPAATTATSTIGKVRKHGDTGIGTINSLYGEMIIVDGVFYQIYSSKP